MKSLWDQIFSLEIFSFFSHHLADLAISSGTTDTIFPRKTISSAIKLNLRRLSISSSLAKDTMTNCRRTNEFKSRWHFMLARKDGSMKMGQNNLQSLFCFTFFVLRPFSSLHLFLDGCVFFTDPTRRCSNSLRTESIVKEELKFCCFSLHKRSCT